MTHASGAAVSVNAEDKDRFDFGPLPSMLGYQIRQAQTAVFRDFAQIMAEMGVTPGEFSLLTLIETNPGTSQVRLASVYRLDKSTLSLTINGLIKRGLVRRTRSTVDKRFYALHLPESGRLVLQRVRERVDAQERAMDAVLHPGEREQLLDALQRISRAFDR